MIAEPISIGISAMKGRAALDHSYRVKSPPPGGEAQGGGDG
jgi:hypothetical protein